MKKAKRLRCLLPGAILALCQILTGVARADSFPPVTDAERALTAVPGAPNAVAAVLFRKGEYYLFGYGRSDHTSRLLVRARLKILRPEGKSAGDVEIVHSDGVRLHGFQGRTVLPDGRVLELPANARFERKLSTTRREYVTSVAFPAVEVGAILDYQYELAFDTVFNLVPWYFAAEVPVLYSEIVFKVPNEIQAASWVRDAFEVGVHHDKPEIHHFGTEIKYWAKGVPAVPQEPLGPPFADLAANALLLPTAYQTGYVHHRLLESWASASELLLEDYDQARRKDRGVADQARQIAARTAGGQREKAAAIYRFVRDEIATRDVPGVFLERDASVAAALAKREGDYAEKALLLQALLKAAGIEARPVWAADRQRGLVDPQIPNPEAFDRVMVAIQLDGRRLLLDPCERALPFGALPPAFEGHAAVLPDAKKPEVVTLSETPCEESSRRAAIELSLDAAGRLRGHGQLTLAGHPAWENVRSRPAGKEAAELWREWLEKRYRGFRVEEVKVEEAAEEARVRVSWSLAQRDEDVLGDEAVLSPSLPLGPASQPLVQERRARRTPLLLPFAEREEVELTLRWPDGWRVESAPKARRQESRLGALVTTVETKADERVLTYRRRFDRCQKQITNLDDYDTVRGLYAAAVASDAETLALVHRR